MCPPRPFNLGVLAALAVAVLFALGGCADGNFGDLLFGGPGGICGLIIVILDIYAFVQIAQSRAEGVTKVLWALLVFFFPVGGFLLWYFFGPKR
jgi:hypothetical protein